MNPFQGETEGSVSPSSLKDTDRHGIEMAWIHSHLSCDRLHYGIKEYLETHMKRWMSAIVVFALSSRLCAGTGTIMGKVTDQATHGPLPGVDVTLAETKIETVSDREGAFKLSGVPEGVYALSASMTGYQKTSITGIHVKTDSTFHLEITLTPSAIEGEAVTISADRYAVQKDVTSSIGGAHADEVKEYKDKSKPGTPLDKSGDGAFSAAEPAPLKAERPSGGYSGLKAGYSDDNKQFNYFVNFLSKYGDQVNHYPIPIEEKIALNVRDAAGQTLPDAEVRVSAGGKTLVSAKTLSDGSFLFFPSEYGGNLSDYRFEITYQDLCKTVETARGGKREIEARVDIKKSRPESVPLDILFILDTTGSMGEEIGRLKKTIELINLNLTAFASKPCVRFGMVLYRDKSDEYVTKIVPFTDNLDLFRNALGQVQANGGGDEPEDLQAAMHAALFEMDWNPKGVRLAFIVTDAPPHLDYGQSYTYVNAARDAKEKGIKLFSVGTGGLNLTGEYILRQISQYTSAKYIFLTYGEKGESEGGRIGSVSHHTGANYETGKLEAVIIKIAKEELGFFSDTPAEEGEDYFAAGRIADESKEETLKKLFGMAVSQLLDYSTVRIADGTPACMIPVSAADGSNAADAEYFSEQFLLALSKNPAFKLVERKNLQQILDELKLGMTGLVNDAQAVQAGKLTGANLLVTGTLYRKPDEFEMFMKLIRIETGEILAVTKLKIDLKLGAGG
jgi:Mg-chelatase subunit ChlD